MRAVIQRVKKSSVTIENKVKSEIGAGLNVLVGIEDADTEEDAAWLCRKISNMRIFDDENGVMNKSLKDVKGELLLISQFTLHASTKKGNRPSYIKAAKPPKAVPIYENLIHLFEKELGKSIKTGEFGAMMQVEIINDGPVSIIIDTKNKE